MAVVNVKKGWSGDSGGAGKNSNQRVCVYTVLTDSAADTWDSAIKNAVGLPKYNDSYPGMGNFGVTSRAFNRKSPTLWDVTVTWTCRTFGGSHSNPDVDPLDQPYEYAWRSQVSREPIEMDAAGNAILNAAGEPFDPPIQEDFYDSVLSITFNSGSFDEAAWRAARGNLNADEFLGGAPGTCKILDGNATQQRNGAITYWRVAVEVAYREDNWKRRVLNQGFRYAATDDSGTILKYEDGSVKYTIACDKAKHPLTKPILLAADGTRLAEGADPIWLVLTTKKSVDYSSLGMG